MNDTANARQPAPGVSVAGEGQAQTGALIKAALSLSQALEALGSLNLLGELSPPDVRGGISFYEEVGRFESALIVEALRITHGRQKEASALLGLNPTTLNCMIKRLGIDTGAFVKAADVKPARRSRFGKSCGNVQPLRQELAAR